ncbi:PEGA domain-containing protein [Candidatus Woesearchaeota archaeon]|nr:PEGA domain-containing protein [Candidatus Woesearchaeota archaeon]
MTERKRGSHEFSFFFGYRAKPLPLILISTFFAIILYGLFSSENFSMTGKGYLPPIGGPGPCDLGAGQGICGKVSSKDELLELLQSFVGNKWANSYTVSKDISSIASSSGDENLIGFSLSPLDYGAPVGPPELEPEQPNPVWIEEVNEVTSRSKKNKRTVVRVRAKCCVEEEPCYFCNARIKVGSSYVAPETDASGWTSRDGSFKSVDVSSGTRKVTLVKEGYFAKAADAKISKGEYVDVTLSLRAKRGSFKNSDTSKSDVYLNGDYVGKTPISIKNLPGGKTYTLLYQKGDYSDVNENVLNPGADPMGIRGGASYDRANLAIFSVTSEPSHADIFINGVKASRQTPFSFDSQYPPREYIIRVEKQGYPTVEKIVSMEKRAHQKVHFDLNRGVVNFVSLPLGAEVYVDGEPQGKTPLNLPIKANKEHGYAFKFGSCKEIQGKFSVTANGEATVSGVFDIPSLDTGWLDISSFFDLPPEFDIGCDNSQNLTDRISELFFNELADGWPDTSHISINYGITGDEASGYTFYVYSAYKKFCPVPEIVPEGGGSLFCPVESLPLKGDLNGDRLLSSGDLQLLKMYVASGQYLFEGDLNQDSLMDDADVQELESRGLPNIEFSGATECVATLSGSPTETKAPFSVDDEVTAVDVSTGQKIHKSSWNHYSPTPLPGCGRYLHCGYLEAKFKVKDNQKLEFKFENTIPSNYGIYGPVYLHYGGKEGIKVADNVFKKNAPLGVFYTSPQIPISLKELRDTGNCCVDADGDGFKRGSGLCGNPDCADDPSSDPPQCMDVVCCQIGNSPSVAPSLYRWGVKTGNTCNNDPNLWALFNSPLSQENPCIKNQIPKTMVCGNSLLADCSFCRFPGAKKACGVDADCSGSWNRDETYTPNIWNGKEDGTACGEDEQCVVHGSYDFGMQGLGVPESPETGVECIYSPAGANGDAECGTKRYTSYDSDGGLSFKGYDETLYSCLPEKESSVVSGRYGELDFNGFYSACKREISPREGYSFQLKTSCVKKDKCRDGFSSTAEISLNQIFSKFDPTGKRGLRTGKNIDKVDFDAEECSYESAVVGEMKARLKDGDHPDCYGRGLDHDGDKFLASRKGFCSYINRAYLKEGFEGVIIDGYLQVDSIPQPIRENCLANYDFCIKERDCFPFPDTSFFPDCDDFTEDDAFQDLNKDGIADYTSIVIGSPTLSLLEPPRVFDDTKLESYNKGDAFSYGEYFIPVTAKQVHPFAVLNTNPEGALCGTTNFIDLNCNKDMETGYEAAYNDGISPFDDDISTGTEVYSGDISLFPSKSRDLFCSPPESIWKANIVYGSALGIGVVATVLGQIYIPRVLLALPELKAPLGLLAGFFFLKDSYHCVTAALDFESDIDAEWCKPTSTRDDCRKFIQAYESCLNALIVPVAIGGNLAEGLGRWVVQRFGTAFLEKQISRLISSENKMVTGVLNEPIFLNLGGQEVTLSTSISLSVKMSMGETPRWMSVLFDIPPNFKVGVARFSNNVLSTILAVEEVEPGRFFFHPLRLTSNVNLFAEAIAEGVESESPAAVATVAMGTGSENIGRLNSAILEPKVQQALETKLSPLKKQGLSECVRKVDPKPCKVPKSPQLAEAVPPNPTFRPITSEITRKDSFRARRFIDKDHYQQALNGKYPDGTPNPDLAQNPGMAYDALEPGAWERWKSADDFLFTQIGEKKGRISKVMVKKVGELLWQNKFRGQNENVMQGGEFEVSGGFFNIYKKSTFEAAKNNPLLTVEASGTLGDYSYRDMLKSVVAALGKDSPTGQYVERNPGEFVVGIIRYPLGEEVDNLLVSLINEYNAKLACTLSYEEWIALAAEFQQKFVSIHPFWDKNGRTSRLFMDYILQSGYVPPAHLRDTSLDTYLSLPEWVTEVKYGVATAISNGQLEIPID